MKIATWNINGVKARLNTVLEWLQKSSPDIACFQEIKSQDEGFPRQAFEDLGYNVETHGQKGFNGVALLSKSPLEDVQRGLPGDETDEQARYIEATVSTETGAIRFGCLYLPNGNPLGTEKFPYKLGWMDRLHIHTQKRLAEETPFLLLGDYNVIPDPVDAKNPENWTDDALFQPESRQRFRSLTHLGFTEAVRSCTEAEQTYTFWDYQAGAWQKNNGIRIDHILMSPQATDRLNGCGIDKHVRGWEKPSDHVPVWVQLAA
ncbi:exodeoxyribonuclease III [Roseibium denhamense]|uniref:Exodeoxyribonuclease III n=1 Tax=Roseibium denhamense TaxID=76305 RepID=A0ABY1PGE2_9HYPH|nr:exodeoxyribonuclease III [Roseibium denhamense]MTI06173.1 exodeoxyribonuclease III [Roseibium denhamense]SMP32377.1 Exodeoxyribonuclease III [Roseibium denhamense]